jgi:hypothetical protein
VDSFRVHLTAVRARVAASGLGIKWAALPVRTRRMAAGGGAGVLVLVVLAGLVLGPLSSHGANGPAATGTPGIATASASASSIASASMSASELASASPTPQGSDDGVSPRVPAVLASVAGCSPDQTVTSGGRLYVSCGFGSKVVAIDLATDAVAQTYALNNPWAGEPGAGPTNMIVDNGLWVSLPLGGAGDDVRRFDLASGKQIATGQQSKDLIGSMIADISGTIWVSRANGGIVKVNTATGTTSPAGPNAAGLLSNRDEFVTSACGMFWGQIAKNGEIVRVNPATDVLTQMGSSSNGYPLTSMYTYQSDGSLVDVVQAGGTCWGAVNSTTNPVDVPGVQGVFLFRLGTSCGDMETDWIASDPYVLGDTFWVVSDDGTYINQVEPFGGKEGRHWLAPIDPTTQGNWIFTPNGQVWSANDAGLSRLDIPLNKMKPGATPKKMSCPKPVATPKPVASAPASANTTPTPTPTPMPTPTPTPSPEPTDSPAP